MIDRLLDAIYVGPLPWVAMAHCAWDRAIQVRYTDAAARLWKSMWVDLRRHVHQQVAIEELQIRMRLARTVATLERWGE